MTLHDVTRKPLSVAHTTWWWAVVLHDDTGLCLLTLSCKFMWSYEIDQYNSYLIFFFSNKAFYFENLPESRYSFNRIGYFSDFLKLICCIVCVFSNNLLFKPWRRVTSGRNRRSPKMLKICKFLSQGKYQITSELSLFSRLSIWKIHLSFNYQGVVFDPSFIIIKKQAQHNSPLLFLSSWRFIHILKEGGTIE